MTVDTTVVCCVESGPLEEQTLRMLESLRTFGGAFANVRAIALTPRFGAPLSGETLSGFRRLDVEYVRFRAVSPHSWNKFMNKPFALLKAGEVIRTGYATWLDSDIVFTGEPENLLPGKGTDFTACPSDKNIGTSGPDDPNEKYWEKITAALNIRLDDLPWLETMDEKARIRFYFNSGVFTYLAGSGFASEYLKACLAILDGRIASSASGIFFIDQVVLGLVAHKLKLGWEIMPFSHNYTLGTKADRKQLLPENLSRGVILHYHDAMWPVMWQDLIDALELARPEFAGWLMGKGPLANRAFPLWRVLSKLLAARRAEKQKKFLSSCQTY